MQGKKQDRIKITTLSAERCRPCKGMQNEIAELSGEFDIDLVIVDADNLLEHPENLDPDAVPGVFGEDAAIPTAIIETKYRSKRLIGYSEGDVRKVIEEILKPEE